VADTGVGMDQETIAKLFTVFFSTKGRRGTGLGLFVANQVVEQHGGHISVRSQPGKGTIFRIDIPRSPAVEG
jgi:signal transduction histidine kinase